MNGEMAQDLKISYFLRDATLHALTGRNCVVAETGASYEMRRGNSHNWKSSHQRSETN